LVLLGRGVHDVLDDLELMEEKIQEHMVVEQSLESLLKKQQRAKKKQKAVYAKNKKEAYLREHVRIALSGVSRRKV
jgi:hypothetical protein